MRATVDQPREGDQPAGGAVLRRLERILVGDRVDGDEARLRARTIGALMFAGGMVGAVSLVLPHPDYFDDAGLWSNTIIAAVAGIAMWLWGERAPRWAPQVVLVAANLLITRAVLLSDEPSGFYAFFYVWSASYAFFFFGRRGGIAHSLFAGVLYAFALSQAGADARLARWLMVLMTMIIVGWFIAMLVRRLRLTAADSQARAARLTAVGRVARRIARHEDSQGVAPAICEAAIEVAEASGSALLVPAPDGRGLTVTHASDPRISRTMIPFAGPPAGSVRAYTSGEPFFIEDARGDSAVEQGVVQRAGAVTCLFQPVIRDDSPIAVLALYWDHRVESPGDEVAEVVSLLATEASIALQRAEMLARLEQAARTDDLTRLANRRAWNDELAREVARAERSGQPLSTVILDLDRFKQYNDTNGHLAGDRFLKAVAAAWRSRIRPTDVLARYGGEEFALALPDCPAERAAELVDRLREVTPEGQTVSAGIAIWTAGELPERLVARADDALYEAKRAGRARSVIAAAGAAGPLA